MSFCVCVQHAIEMANGKWKSKRKTRRRQTTTRVKSFCSNFAFSPFSPFHSFCIAFWAKPKGQTETHRETDRQTVSHQWVVGECGGKSPWSNSSQPADILACAYITNCWEFLCPVFLLLLISFPFFLSVMPFAFPRSFLSCYAMSRQRGTCLVCPLCKVSAGCIARLSTRLEESLSRCMCVWVCVFFVSCHSILITGRIQQKFYVLCLYCNDSKLNLA